MNEFDEDQDDYDAKLADLRDRVSEGLVASQHLRDVECGYTSLEALVEIERLSPLELRRLASMAIRAYDSPWSDSARDLARGTEKVLGRRPLGEEPE